VRWLGAVVDDDREGVGVRDGGSGLRLDLLRGSRVLDRGGIHESSLAVGLVVVVFDGKVDGGRGREYLRVDVLLSIGEAGVHRVSLRTGLEL
jgi:hypothetical protein